MTTVFLLRHAESAPDWGMEESDWPLSKRGEDQAVHLCECLTSMKIGHVYSSPYERALATVRPFAKSFNLPIEIAEDLRERKLVEGFRKDWPKILQHAWADLNFSHPNCESGKVCQSRVRRCIDALAADCPGGNILVSSHGNAIGLYLNLLDRSFGYREWAAMKFPDLFKIIYRDGVAAWDRNFTYSQI